MKITEKVAILHSIARVTGSNLGTDRGYLDWGYLLFLISSSNKRECTSHKATTFHHYYNSFINHPVIQHYTV